MSSSSSSEIGERIKKHNNRALWLRLEAKNRSLRELESQVRTLQAWQAEHNHSLADVRAHWAMLSSQLAGLASRALDSGAAAAKDLPSVGSSGAGRATSFLDWLRRALRLAGKAAAGAAAGNSSMTDGNGDGDDSEDDEEDDEEEGKGSVNKAGLSLQYVRQDEQLARARAKHVSIALAQQREAVTKLGIGRCVAASLSVARGSVILTCVADSRLAPPLISPLSPLPPPCSCLWRW